MKYARVVTAIPIDQTFDYIIPKNLSGKVKVGCRVVIPFRNKNLIGYVTGLTNRARVKKLKSILKLIDSEPLLSYKLLNLTKKISDYYCCSWAEAIEVALPLSIRKKRNLEVLSLQQSVVSRKKDKDKFEVLLVYDKDGNKRYDFYFEEIEKTLNLNRSVMFLSPEVWQLLRMQDLLKKRFEKKIIIIHRKLSYREELKAYKEIKENKNFILIGTRSAVFSPISDLGLIILDFEEDPNFKQDQKPFYHARDVAIMRAEEEGIKVILGSQNPSLESFYLAENKRYRLINLERTKEFPEVKIVDMRKEIFEKKRVLSTFLERKINQTIQNRGKTLIFFNRLGFATYNYCRKCGFVLKCPKCEVTLTYIYEKKMLLCNYCHYTIELLEICPNCHSDYIRYKGFGLEKLESYLQRIFPQARIERLQRDYKKDVLDKDILISTRIITKEPDLNFDLLGIILADSPLNLVDFRASEKAFSLFYKLILLSKNAIIQSYIPNNYTFKYLAKGDYYGFYKEELKQRRLLNFPPFRNLIMINLRGQRENTLIRRSNLLFKRIKESIKDKDTEIFSPTPDIPPKLRGKFRYRVLLKTKNLKKLSLALKRILKDFSRSKIVITVDVNPM